MRLGPDAARYWHAAAGHRVSRPFHLRWLLPWACGHDLRRWWFVWAAGWVLMAAGMVLWQVDHGWQIACASAVLLVGLPGILGPGTSIPVGVDIPATGLTVAAVGMISNGWIVPGVLCLAVAVCVRETSPVWAALWLWTPWPLLLLAFPAITHLVRRPGVDPLGEKFQQIADHPVRSSLAFHQGRWRDGWLMVAPWGACLAALHQPSLQLVVLLAVAYAQLLVATDSVRLYQNAAGPVMAAAAATVIPAGWLWIAVAVHVVWWRTPERI